MDTIKITQTKLIKKTHFILFQMFFLFFFIYITLNKDFIYDYI